MRHRIVAIRNRQNPGFNWYVFPRQTIGITSAVHPLVMMLHRPQYVIKTLQRRQGLMTNAGVLANATKTLQADSGSLTKKSGRYRQQAHIMKPTR